MQDDEGNLLVAGRYTPPSTTQPATMEVVDIIERDADRQPTAHLLADRAEWNAPAGPWILTNGRRIAPPQEPGRAVPVTEFQTSIRPTEIQLYRDSSVVDLLSTPQINGLLQHPKSYGTLDLLRVKHWRFTQPLANIVMLLLAIPCVLTRNPGSLKMAALKCCLLTGACMAAMFVAHQLSGTPPTGSGVAANPQLLQAWPALLAWMPILIFGPLSIWLLDRVKT